MSGETNIKTIFVALILIGGLSVGFLAILSGLMDSYGTAIEPEYVTQFETMNNATNAVSNNVYSMQTHLEEFSTKNAFVTGFLFTYDMFSLIINIPLSIITSIITLSDVAISTLEVPLWFTIMATTIVLAVIIFIILKILTNRSDL